MDISEYLQVMTHSKKAPVVKSTIGAEMGCAGPGKEFQRKLP
ncbi:MAG: hypothetical protein ACI3X3_00590 [Acidaminococcus sp.]